MTKNPYNELASKSASLLEFTPSSLQRFGQFLLLRLIKYLLNKMILLSKGWVDDLVEEWYEEEDEDRVDDSHLLRLDIQAPHLSVHPHSLQP